MNFKGHLIGGIVSGSLVTVGVFSGNFLLAEPLLITDIAKLFPITLFFALFPDFDTSSIPQRWFFRSVFVVILILGYYRYFEEATILALVAITPVLDHHRGWTHNLLSAALVPVVLAAIYEYILSKERWFQSWSIDNVPIYLKDNLWLVLACVCGWYTHLLLDSKIPIFRNSKSHR